MGLFRKTSTCIFCLLSFPLLEGCNGSPRAASDISRRSEEIRVFFRQGQRRDVPSEKSCEIYEDIKARGLKICTNNCRPFAIVGGSPSAYLENALCACEVTPKNIDTSNEIRGCLQWSLLLSPAQGKTIWTLDEVRVHCLDVQV